MSTQPPQYQHRFLIQSGNGKSMESHPDFIKRILEKEVGSQIGSKTDLDTDIIFYPDDYTLQNVMGWEYLSAMKQEKRLRKIVPDLSIPRSKQREVEEVFIDPDRPAKPVRKVPRSAMRVTGVTWNDHADLADKWESRIEGDYLTLLKFDPTVDFYLTQPVAIGFFDNQGKHHTYTPDIYVEYKPEADGYRKPPFLGDYKWQKDLALNGAVYAEKFLAAEKFAALKGWEFDTITEAAIPLIRLKNIKKLHRPIHTKGSKRQQELAQRIIEKLFQKKKSTPDKLMKSLPKADREEALFVIWMLIGRHDIECNLDDKALTVQAEIRLADKYVENITVTSAVFPGKGKRRFDGKK